MRKSFWLLSAGLFALSTPAFAQQTDTDQGTAQPTDGATAEAAAVDNQATPSDTEAQATNVGDIVVTATRRNAALSDVPLAVSAVTSESLENSGASDIRQLTQLSPSLLVSSTSSEAGAAVARIRGIGTVGDNPGLEGSVGVFVDGVYRSRAGTALTELGQVDRIEVLRGPQGTLFGRNTSAGLISVITARPKFVSQFNGQLDIGNYNMRRIEVGATGPLTDQLAARIDGIYSKRDGFLRDTISGRDINNRDRWLVRGQLLFKPNDDLSVRVIADYAKRDEECCGAIYAPLVNYQRDPATPVGQVGTITTVPASFATVLRGLTDPAGNPVFINDDINRRETAITPGRDYHQFVKDSGISGEIVYDLGGAELTSITAYRAYRLDRGADADFNNYDILYRTRDKRDFDTFTQEIRLQGTTFGERLDWLVGGYYANETINVSDNLKFGTQFGNYANLLVNAGLPGFAGLGGYANLPTVVNTLLSANPLIPAAARGAIVAQIQPVLLSNVGIDRDNYEQKSRNFAFFTHNIFKVTDRVNFTVGLRYTNESKELSADLLSNNLGCASIRGSIARLNTLAAASPTLAPIIGGPAGVAAQLTGLAAIPCVANLNTGVDGVYRGKKKEDNLSGTASLSFKPTDQLLTYASYSRGYKAGGFNFDRSGLSATAPSIENLKFEPETVNAFEVGAKYNSRMVDVNVAGFYQVFDQFQLNTFNGINFLVENIQACDGQLGTPPAGSVYGSCASSDVRAGVTSKGAELEVFVYPRSDVTIGGGFTYVDTKYRDRLVGLGGRPLVNDLFLLPGERLSNSAQQVFTASVSFNPQIAANGIRALFYVDGRHQSAINSGSDLDIEKVQPSFTVVNGRIGIQGPERRWSVELWAQNLFNEDYAQVYFDAPFQPLGGPPGGRVTALPRGATYAVDRSTALFGRFLGEPRTYGLTLRTRL